MPKPAAVDAPSCSNNRLAVPQRHEVHRNRLALPKPTLRLALSLTEPLSEILLKLGVDSPVCGYRQTNVTGLMRARDDESPVRRYNSATRNQ